MRKILKEPLLHFLLLGAALFGLYGLVSRPGAREPEQIVVSRLQVESLHTAFARTWQRPPTERELAGLIDEYVKEEVLCREALALGLDRDDTVVRRRLRQKMEFIAADVAAAREPTEAELQAHFDAHAAEYRTEQRLSFTQVYFNAARPPEATVEAVDQALAALDAGGATINLDEQGDPSLLERHFPDATTADVARTFGPAFAKALTEVETGKWVGPVSSAYGVHVVRVRERIDAGTPTLADVRDAVHRDWANAHRFDANEKLYASIRAKYGVTIERPGPSASIVATGAPAGSATLAAAREVPQ